MLYRYTTASNSHASNIVIRLKNTISMMSMLMTTHTVCEMAIGKWQLIQYATPEGHCCCCCCYFAFTIQSISMAFTPEYGIFSILMPFSSVHWIRIRCTGTRGQHKSNGVEMRCEKGLVWALPCVLIDCIIIFSEKIEWTTVCDNGGW